MRNAPDAVMIYAAGFGTRMRPLTDTQPKPLIPVAGRALIDHALDQVRAVQPRVVAANLHYRADQLAAHLQGSGVETLRETPGILDMGGGLRAAQPTLGDGPVWTMNPDALWRGPNPLEIARSAWQPETMDALLVCVPLAQTIGRVGGGDFVMDEDGRLSAGDAFVYGGVQIITLDRLMAKPAGAFPIQPIWQAMADDGRLFGVPYPGHWCDIGTPDGIALAEEMLRDV